MISMKMWFAYTGVETIFTQKSQKMASKMWKCEVLFSNKLYLQKIFFFLQWE